MCWMVYSLWGNQHQQLMKLIANNFSLRAGNYELQYIYTLVLSVLEGRIDCAVMELIKKKEKKLDSNSLHLIFSFVQQSMK